VVAATSRLAGLSRSLTRSSVKSDSLMCARRHRAAQQRLNVGSFRGWLYRLRKDAPPGKVARSATRLLPVRVGPVGVAQDKSTIEVVVGEALVRIRGGIARAYVADLVAQLRSRR
jgi:hypothetical protein